MSDFKYKGKRVLLTEGKNDCFVIVSLLAQNNVTETFGLYDCGSDLKALKRLSALLAGSEEQEIIGIVLDADNPTIQSKWDAVKNRLIGQGYTVSSKPQKGGTILTSSEMPKIGIWLMPDNNIDGMLEDFCRSLASPEAMNYAQTCATEAKHKGFSSYKSVHLSKSTIHTFLAWQNEPGMPLGQAITSKVLDSTQPLAKEFIAFLTDLFD